VSQILKSKLLPLQSTLQLQKAVADRIELVRDDLQVNCKNPKVSTKNTGLYCSFRIAIFLTLLSVHSATCLVL